MNTLRNWNNHEIISASCKAPGKLTHCKVIVPRDWIAPENLTVGREIIPAGCKAPEKLTHCKEIVPWDWIAPETHDREIISAGWIALE